MISVTDRETQTRLDELLDTVQREAISITQHGRVAAVLVSPQEMQDLLGANFKQVSLVEAVEAHFARAMVMLASIVGSRRKRRSYGKPLRRCAA